MLFNRKKNLKILNIFFHNNLNTVNIIRFVKILIYKNNALLYIFVKAKSFFVKPKSQSDECRIITQLIQKYKIYGNFLEIGYSPWEYNFCQLDPHKGIIVDANPLNIKIGRWLNNKSKFICQFLTLNNIKKFIKNINVKIDLLSLDIDGNDYYLMKKLIKLNPKLVVCEYNPVFF